MATETTVEGVEDPYGTEIPVDPAAPVVGDVGQPADTSQVAAPVVPAVPGAAAVISAPAPNMNTMYGVDNESYLTDDQKKLARQIQGKFDASLNVRDRELAQYGAPKLSSFVEDEALARAMTLARGLNAGSGLDTVGGRIPSSGGGGSGGGGGGSSRPYDLSSLQAPAGSNPATASRWQRLLNDLSTIVPLLLGKDGMSSLLKDGLIKKIGGFLSDTAKEWFGSSPSPQQIAQALRGPDPENPMYNYPTAARMYYDHLYDDEGAPWASNLYDTGAGSTPVDFGPGSEAGWGGNTGYNIVNNVPDWYGYEGMDWGSGIGTGLSATDWGGLGGGAGTDLAGDALNYFGGV